MKEYTIREAAKELGKTVRTIRYYLHEGMLIGEKRGAAWVIPEDEIERMKGRCSRKSKTSLWKY